MPDIKNYDKNETEKDLKRADAEKSSGTVSQLAGISLNKARKGDDGGFKVKRTARKRLPIVVDIIIAILFVALFGGVITGAYFAFRNFAVDFESVNVEYTMLVTTDNAADYAGLEGQALYLDVDGSVEFFGKVKSVQASEKNGGVLVVVESTVRYKEGDGYSIGDVKFAVGQEYALRTQMGKAVGGVVIELCNEKYQVPAEASLPMDIIILEAKGGR